MPEYGQLTLGAVVALLILKEVLPTLRKQRAATPAAATASPVDAADLRAAVDTALLINVLPILRAQTEILAELKAISRKQEERFIGLQYTVDEVKGDTSATRANIHGLRNDLQRMAPTHPSPSIG